MTRERIVDAAVLRLVQGPNHADCIAHFAGPVTAAEQGFVTDTGRFVGRAEALRIALASGQLEARVKHHPVDLLMSEDLWDDVVGWAAQPEEENGG